MDTKYDIGIENFKENYGNSSLLLLKPAESRTIRFLLEPRQMPIIKRHWVNGQHSYIKCNGTACPLCREASSTWGAPITIARNYFLAPLIDRSDNKVRVFECGQAVVNRLLRFSKGIGITNVDFKLSRNEGKKGQELYDLSPIDKDPSPLTADEKDRINEVDQDWLLSRGKRTSVEMEAMIEEGNAS
jgi:hypothetical protein